MSKHRRKRLANTVSIKIEKTRQLTCQELSHVQFVTQNMTNAVFRHLRDISYLYDCNSRLSRTIWFILAMFFQVVTVFGHPTSVLSFKLVRPRLNSSLSSRVLIKQPSYYIKLKPFVLVANVFLERFSLFF